MTTGNISANPLNVLITLTSKLTTASVTDNSQYSPTTLSLASELPLITAQAPALATQLQPILPAINTPLGTLFNTQWASSLSAEESAASQVFSNAAANAKFSVNSVTTSFPASGTLMATTVDAVAATPNAVPASLTLSFQLPGSEFQFGIGGQPGLYKITFDATILINTTVPVLPFSLTPTATIYLANASLQTANAAAAAWTGSDNFVTALGDTFGQSTNISNWQADQNLVPGDVNGVYPAPSGPGLMSALSLFTGLNSASSEVAALGFTECGFSIVNIATQVLGVAVNTAQLTLSLTHPQDPGPQISNEYAPSVSLAYDHPQLALSATQVKPGGSVTVVGSGFPVATSTQATLQWASTSSGTPSGAQIRWEPGGSITSVAGPTNGLYSHTLTGLTPNKTYQVWARCGDQLTWSFWNDNAFSLGTGATDTFELMLRPTGKTTGVSLASLTLSPTATGWTKAVTIPAGTAPGSYDIAAAQGGSVMGSVAISVVSDLTAVLQIYDPTSKTVVVDVIITNGGAFTVRGENFPNGKVTLSVTGMPNVEVTASGGAFQEALKAPGNPGEPESVPITVTATSVPTGGAAAVTASVKFTTIGAPE